MKTFSDTTGRQWQIVLNLGTAERIKNTLGVDLLQPESGDVPVLTRLGTDELLLGNVICCLLTDQFEKHDVTEDDVKAAFDGQTILAAQSAFYEEMIDFFQSRGRGDRARAVATQREMIKMAVEMAEQKVAAIDVKAKTLGAMSGSSPESSE